MKLAVLVLSALAAADRSPAVGADPAPVEPAARDSVGPHVSSNPVWKREADAEAQGWTWNHGSKDW
jgi:hypothetical protein